MLSDFVIRHDQEKETGQDLARKIFKSLFIHRIENQKPCVIFIAGGSGEGKSKTAIKIQEELCGLKGLNIREHFEVMNVYTPLEYPQKLQKILNDKKHKKVFILCVHESRILIKGKNWQSFLTQAIADINALVRAKKRLVIILLSQSLKDITKEIRHTINYYVDVKRPLHLRARIKIFKMYHNDLDLENIKLKKRKIRGLLIDKKKKYRRFIPDAIEITLPSKDLCDEFDKRDRESKEEFLNKKAERLMDEIKKDLMVEDTTMNKFVNYYFKNIEKLLDIGAYKKDKFKLDKHFIESMKFNKKEVKDLEKLANLKLKELGYDKE